MALAARSLRSRTRDGAAGPRMGRATGGRECAAACPQNKWRGNYYSAEWDKHARQRRSIISRQSSHAAPPANRSALDRDETSRLSSNEQTICLPRTRPSGRSIWRLCDSSSRATNRTTKRTRQWEKVFRSLISFYSTQRQSVSPHHVSPPVQKETRQNK